MTGCEECRTRNQCAENESDVYHYHVGCISHNRRQNAGMRRLLNKPRNCDNKSWERAKNIEIRRSNANNDFANLRSVRWLSVNSIR